VDVAGRFLLELSQVRASRSGPELLPDQLSVAAARTLGVDAVGLTLAAQQPASIGASDDMAALAEQLQFTVGNGPCMVTVDTQMPLFAVEAYLQRRWPFFHDLLRTRTPYRSVVTFPLTGALAGVGAMVVYLASPAGPLEFDALEAQSLVGVVSGELGRSAVRAQPLEPDLQHWIDVPGARVRTAVWQAVGMVTVGLGLSSPDALAFLRARAYGSGRLVDEVADDLVSNRVSVRELFTDPAR
jgi:hypothetical protein